MNESEWENCRRAPDKLLVLLAGQSNMAGRGYAGPDDLTPIPNVLMIRPDGKWQPAIEPITKDRAFIGTFQKSGEKIVSDDPFETVLPHTDMFLYDFKCADPEKHQRLTGSRNELILENLKKLDLAGKEIEIRMILVPEHNMSEDDLRAAGGFLAPLEHVSAVRLLAYHSLARSKFKAVGHPDTMPDVPSPDADTLEKCAEILRSRGVKNVVNSLK